MNKEKLTYAQAKSSAYAELKNDGLCTHALIYKDAGGNYQYALLYYGRQQKAIGYIELKAVLAKQPHSYNIDIIDSRTGIIEILSKYIETYSFIYFK